MYKVGQIHIRKSKMNEYFANWAVKCEFHHSRLFASGKSETDLS